MLEIIAGIRAACGKNFPLGVRLSAEEFLGDKGNDLEASSRIAVELEKAGMDFLDISTTIPDSSIPSTACIEPGTFEQGWKRYMAAAIKKHVKIPIIAVANIKEPAVAEAILGKAAATLWASRAGISRTRQWCEKGENRQVGDHTKCIGCLVCFDEIEHCGTSNARSTRPPAANANSPTQAAMARGERSW